MNASSSYNLASAQLYLWQLAVEQKGLGDAWLNKRSHLHEARRLFNLVAQDKDADKELRLKALTDCGNSFDIVGRYLDALDCYERALKLDSSFGMASGTRGITLLNVAPLMGGHESHVLLQATADLDTAISDQERVLRCGGQSALDTFKAEPPGELSPAALGGWCTMRIAQPADCPHASQSAMKCRTRARVFSSPP